MARDTETGGAGGRRARRDAEGNRRRVLGAAAVAVRAEGSNVPMATVAARAGVGIGTVYRHFPGRWELLAALTERSFAIVLDVRGRRRVAAGQRVADEREERLLARRRAGAQQVRGRLGGVAEPVRRVGRDVRRLAGAQRRRGPPEGHLDGALQHAERLLEVVAVGRRAAAGRDEHVDEREAPEGVLAADQDRVDGTELAARRERAGELSAQSRTEFVAPG